MHGATEAVSASGAAVSSGPSALSVESTAAHAAVHPLACRNCGNVFGAVVPNFCPVCGQDTHPHPPSAWEFIHEFITHYVALEGKLSKTLGLLFFKPGELTKQFSQGKKLRYVHPLRLYITASFLFFLVVKVAGFGHIFTTNAAPDGNGAVASSPMSTDSARRGSEVYYVVPKEVATAPPTLDMGCATSDAVCLSIEKRLKRKWQGKTTADVIATMKQSVISNLPYAMFFMLPVFACMTYWLYWRRRFTFGEHMVYAMHVHALAYFSLLGKATLPPIAGDVLLYVSLVWYFVAMQRFFGGRIWANLIRYCVIGTLYPVFLAVLTGGVILLAVAV
jgi:hypothetical protein